MTATHTPARSTKSVKSSKSPNWGVRVGIGVLAIGVLAFAGTSVAGRLLDPPAQATPVVTPKPASGNQSGSGQTSSNGSGPLVSAGDIGQLHQIGAPVITDGQGASRWASMSDFLTFVLNDADGYWSNVFVAAGLPEPQTTYQFPAPGEAPASPCGTTSDSTAWYCSTDNTITVSQAFAVSIWDGSLVGPDHQKLDGPGGDFATAYIIAHEFAHSMQYKLGLTPANGYSAPATEQHADCWAGVWARHASDEGMLDPGDVAEGINGTWLVGDSSFQAGDHHGTSESREGAFITGFNAGTPRSCDAVLYNPGQ